MSNSTFEITASAKGINRIGKADFIDQENRGLRLPESLHDFVPGCIETTTHEDLTERVEQHMGSTHPHPLSKVETWWDARSSMWTSGKTETKSLRKWLKSIVPHGKLNISDLRKILKKTTESVPSNKWFEQVLNSELTLALHTGPTHNALTPKRVREQGFICWRYAAPNGTRGTDMAPFVEPDGYPLDVQLHILKWAWFNDAPKALRCLEHLHPHASQSETVTVLNISHHPSLKRRWVERMLGCTIGSQPRHQVARALYRAKKLNLCGQAIGIETDMEVTPKKDSNFFLPRSRNNTQLFSKWHEGIQLDEEGRYSLTPEHHALTIAKHIEAPIVYDAFSGCGGNTIAFARQGHIGVVISNELNHTRSNMCQHNAKLYGVTDTVTFTSHDALQHFPEAPFVFVDPPWAWGQERLEECWQIFNSHYPHGMMKIPVDFPVPIGTKVRLFSTDNHFPSFLVLLW